MIDGFLLTAISAFYAADSALILRVGSVAQIRYGNCLMYCGSSPPNDQSFALEIFTGSIGLMDLILNDTSDLHYDRAQQVLLFNSSSTATNPIVRVTGVGLIKNFLTVTMTPLIIQRLQVPMSLSRFVLVNVSSLSFVADFALPTPLLLDSGFNGISLTFELQFRNAAGTVLKNFTRTIGVRKPGPPTILCSSTMAADNTTDTDSSNSTNSVPQWTVAVGAQNFAVTCYVTTLANQISGGSVSLPDGEQMQLTDRWMVVDGKTYYLTANDSPLFYKLTIASVGLADFGDYQLTISPNGYPDISATFRIRNANPAPPSVECNGGPGTKAGEENSTAATFSAAIGAQNVTVMCFVDDSHSVVSRALFVLPTGQQFGWNEHQLQSGAQTYWLTVADSPLRYSLVLRTCRQQDFGYYKFNVLFQSRQNVSFSFWIRRDETSAAWRIRVSSAALLWIAAAWRRRC